MDQYNLKKAKELIKLNNENICNCCLGRKFSNLKELENISGNRNRGKLINEKLSEKDYNYKKSSSCKICNDILFKVHENIANENILKKIIEKIDYLNLKFETFLIGSKIPNKILEKDEELNNILDLDVENIKKEINREIGKLIEVKLNKTVDFENPDIVIMVDLRKILDKDKEENAEDLSKIKIRIQINPIFIEGKYKKLIRGIPQTKWPCRKCKGKGCDECNGTGKMYNESVEELISNIVLKETNGYEAKFHGAGREDIDVRMLGEGRPFVLEIKEPKFRKLDLYSITNKVNEYSEGKTEYNDLKFTERNRKAEIKVSSPDTFKVYRALVECEAKISEKDLSKIKQLENTIIKQRTPQRVSHRRADKVREREVKEVSTNLINSNTFEMIVKTQGGLYIKELISSDNSRTNPSVSQILNTKSICKELDVIEVG
ncbi:tRNA pseudouridine(54/55) synthase Pus10 [Methanobrevibacter arboriphilus]|jgi:tRNA pseudouridine synthase 10|uniref:tRNA pseudouridine(54/55) synthase Pus10 n=2 Tax=Methanobrevibacter arboriphilus TaxID=39441 RepID=A0ACA8R4U6_METAZ|nr:tRNA pseudouridine(54/55) synthase Pus10 [Methanobrevibacter arboriphilus]MCC7561242.1 tRNA pseudouridine(54/55) synthase Pus10 [Methanobrevibacter arboriphilus]BBL62287.1 tRNA pseudouridine(54/55) synthase Pus10 [Methanobrevibacter arboriphilus]GLI11480.1 tRNA pseudouridine(54/55) synthase Pus10 [Methanobrevibacter arboriphilus]